MGKELRIGIIGFDTSHTPAFTRLLNDSTDPFHVPGARVVAGFPSASPDIPSSISRLEGYKKEVTENWGVALVDSVDELVARVDAVLLESNDGRRHLPEATPVIKARKPVFIDKPMATSYADAAAIFALARQHDCPVFSSSSLRFDANIAGLRKNPELGRVFACDAFSPATLESTNPGLFWYGIHGVEILYAYMGIGCRALDCAATETDHKVIGYWPDNRIASVRGTRVGSHDYGATVFGEKLVYQVVYSRDIPLYSQLLNEIIPFFQGGPPPVAAAETLEIIAFIEAAAKSEREKREVALSEVTGRRVP